MNKIKLTITNLDNDEKLAEVEFINNKDKSEEFFKLVAERIILELKEKLKNERI